jgi:RimJ/RimL family protein N-acetyltransferase
MPWYRDDYSVADAETWIRQSLVARERGTGFQFAICESDGMLVGVLGIEDVNETTGRAMVGYWVTAPSMGRGIGKGAVAHALAWARLLPQVRIVWAWVAETNDRSRRVLEANGFRLVGTRDMDERGDVPLIYELNLRAPSPV